MSSEVELMIRVIIENLFILAIIDFLFLEKTYFKATRREKFITRII
tara:strand:+ start:2600 stop:2737 length:138 start_codon:yes stop_codon:yes gene_type:complete